MPLLTTKLYLPIPRPDAVSRPRLVARLNAGFPRKLTLVSAPAGYGKSTLLSAWLTEHARVTWLSLNADDSDPTRFLLYLLAALGRVIPGVDEGAIERLAANTLAPSKALLTTILNQIAGADPTTLVLDDYHMVQSEAIDDLMRRPSRQSKSAAMLRLNHANSRPQLWVNRFILCWIANSKACSKPHSRHRWRRPWMRLLRANKMVRTICAASGPRYRHCSGPP